MPCITTPDNRFACIDNMEEAIKLIKNYNNVMTKAFSDYADAEHYRNIISEQTAKIRKDSKEAENKFNNTEVNLMRSETALKETEIKVKNVQEQLKQSMNSFADAYLKDTSDVELPDILPQVKGMTNVYEQHEKYINDLINYREEYKRIKELFDKQKSELDRQMPLMEETESSNNVAIKKYDESFRALLPGKLFLYDLIILDLRLERLKDKDRLPREISGIKLLRMIKEVDPSIPVLMFTASEKAMNYREVMDFGASGYWIKGRNSLSDLKSEIINSLKNANELRTLWINIKKIEAKKQLSGYRENTARIFEKFVINEMKKAEIIVLLKESFLLLMKELTPYEELVCSYTNYSKMALNMGLIQEERFGNIRGDKWDVWARQNKIDKDEQRIRQIRNRAAHQGRSNITYQEALEVFQKTLERCLKV